MPKQFRIIVQNLPENAGPIVVQFGVRHPHRMEVYKNEIYQIPNNVYKDHLGETKFGLPDSKFVPNLSELKNGENYFDRTE
jgi:hypothetical protein